jgi:hypothetical protein
MYSNFNFQFLLKSGCIAYAFYIVKKPQEHLSRYACLLEYLQIPKYILAVAVSSL